MHRMTFRLCVREYYDYRSCQRVQHITLDRALGTRRSMHTTTWTCAQGGVLRRCILHVFDFMKIVLTLTRHTE